MAFTGFTISTRPPTRRSASSKAACASDSAAKNGSVVSVEAGDAVVIPAGVSHCNEGASEDLMVVGTYPGGREPDMERHGSDEASESARKRIASVPRPETDPLFGKDGPLPRSWHDGKDG
jgi:uncharacterized protein YjlB